MKLINLALSVISACWLAGYTGSALAQRSLPKSLANGDVESSSEGRPDGWNAPRRDDVVFELTEDRPYDGSRSLLVDTSDSEAAGPYIVSQALSAESFRGQRTQFRAAVRVSDAVGDARAQLWMRVDRRTGSQFDTLAFDNMDDRPIRAEEWQPYHITLDVADDASVILVGMFVIGKAKVSFDGFSLEAVDDSIPTTDRHKGRSLQRAARQQQQARGRQLSPELMAALRNASSAPQQSFWTPWLWLVAAGVSLMLLSARSPKLIEVRRNEEVHYVRANGPLTKFAFRFTFVYWIIYFFPQPLATLSNRFGMLLVQWRQRFQDWAVPWVAEDLFGLDGPLVPPNGSGDTTVSYLCVLMCAATALGVSVVWTVIDRRTTDYRVMKDLLRSFLRYAVGITMLGYGMAKASYGMNQFPVVGDFQLSQTWGDSSPMGVVWKFMGTSRPYTVFAGLGEIAGGILLMFRRTTLLGAMVTFGVMVNVMMLNYCYDIPVKLYSTHLVVAALYLMLHDLYGRLGSILFWNQPTEKVEFRPAYVNDKTVWIQRAIKLALLVVLLVIPLYQHVQRQIEFRANLPDEDPTEETSTLRSRGFRWINEVPFNR